MRALTFAGDLAVALSEVASPELTATGAVVRSTAATVCTSDVHCVHGARGLPVGRILGHESVGVVEAVGPLVERIRPGDRVVCNAIASCGVCDPCQRGDDAYCEAQNGTMHFVSRRHGTLADFFAVDYADRNLAVIPDSVSDEAAVYCADMLTTGFTAAVNASTPPGGTVVILGQGPVGLATTMALRALGAGLIVAVEPDVSRHPVSLRAGADLVLSDGRGPALRDAAPKGFDASVDAVGGLSTIALCAELTRHGGTISNVGFHTGRETLEIPLTAIRNGMSGHEIRLALTPGGSELMGRLLRLISNERIDPTLLTSHRLPFAEAVTAYSLMETKAGGVLKPILFWP